MARPLSAPTTELPSYVLSIFDKQFGCINVQDLENFIQCKWHKTALPSADAYNEAWWGWPDWVFRHNDELRDGVNFIIDHKYLFTVLLMFIMIGMVTWASYRIALNLFPRMLQNQQRRPAAQLRRRASADDVLLNKQD